MLFPSTSFVSSLALSFCVLAHGAEAAAQPVEFWVNSQSDEKYYHSMIQAYKAKVDPAFEANVRSYGFTEMPDKLAIAIKTGINPPDIVQLDEIYFSLYLRGTIPFTDITSRVKKSGLDQGILPQRMGLFTWKDKIYGLPQSVSNVVLYYREDIFKELGITPKSIDTWPKLEAAAKKIRTDARSMLALDWSYFEILMRQRGYELFDKDGKPLPDSAVAVETLKKLVAWKNRGHRHPSGSRQHFRSGVLQLLRGRQRHPGRDRRGLVRPGHDPGLRSQACGQVEGHAPAGLDRFPFQRPESHLQLFRPGPGHLQEEQAGRTAPGNSSNG